MIAFLLQNSQIYPACERVIVHLKTAVYHFRESECSPLAALAAAAAASFSGKGHTYVFSEARGYTY